MAFQIFLDVDGVLAKFVDGVFRKYKIPASECDVTQWDFFELFGIDPKSFWENTDTTFWENLETYDWAHSLVSRLSSYGKLRFATTASGCPYAASAKQRWIFRNFGVRPSDVIIIQDKYLLASSENHILIDDYTENCLKWNEAGGLAILFAQPWNQDAQIKRHSYEDTLSTINLLHQLSR